MSTPARIGIEVPVLLTVLYGLTWYGAPMIGQGDGFAKLAHTAIWSYGVPILLAWEMWLVSCSVDEKQENQPWVVELLFVIVVGLVVLLICIWGLEFIEWLSPPTSFLGVIMLLICGIPLGVITIPGYFILHSAAFLLLFLALPRAFIGVHFLMTHHPAEYLAVKNRFSVADAKRMAQMIGSVSREIKQAPFAFISRNLRRRADALREKIKSDTELGKAVEERVITDNRKEKKDAGR